MIKAGQFLSSRLDILPAEITRELEGLQDEVTPESVDEILAQIEQDLEMPVGTAFARFDTEPIAAASLGQAHRAKLSPGLAGLVGYEDVIVKVLRPGIQDIVEIDLKALRKIGTWMSRVKLISRRADVPRLVEEFAKTSLEEIDYLREAANLERFAANFANDDIVSTPEIVWDRSSSRVLTLSDVSAIKITDVERLEANGIDPDAVAAELARVTFEQFFVNGFFHADPHPGNIFVTPAKSGSASPFTLTFIDFGMMGEITDLQRKRLQSFIFAVVARDARGWITAIEELGLLLPTADTVQLEKAITELFKRFGGVAVTQIAQTDPREIREFAARFSDLVLALPFQFPENFLMLLRSISVISGVTSALNRDFNMWDAVDPFARSLLNSARNGTLQQFGADAYETLANLARIPGRIESLATRAERGELSTRNPELEARLTKLDGSTRRLGSALVFTALLGAGVALRIADDALGTWLLVASLPALLHALGLFRLR